MEFYKSNLEDATAQQAPVEIPMEAVSADAIEGIIDNFIQREGTDYGKQEIAFETKREQVRKQLVSKKVVIVFDPNSESVTLLTSQDWLKLKNAERLS